MASDGAGIRLRENLDMGLFVCRQYSWLLDSYILDHFVERHFDQLPRIWSHHLKNTSVQELGRFVDFENCQPHTVWPLSLLALRSLLKHLSLPRKLNKMNLTHAQSIGGNKEFAENLINSIQIGSNGTGDTTKTNLLTNPKLKTLFIKHVKPKKRYEIVEMAKMTSEISYSLDVEYLVDIGSGLGHLSRILGYGFGLNVLSVESQESLYKEAEKFDSELEVTASKHLNEEEMKIIKKKRPVLVKKTVTGEGKSDEFSDFLRKSFNFEEANFKFGIIGLHPCGNLAVKLLQLFIQCEEAKFINIVGCCYHKVTVSSNSGGGDCFPISNYCKKRKGKLSNEAKALACHALETYCKRLQRDECDHLKIHCFRATLENIIYKNWPHLRKSALNNVKHGPNLTFKLYCENALKKTEISISDEDLECQETLNCLSEWKNVAFYYSLRLMLAPLVETVILIDRILYVMENGYQCSVQALFEPETSPRNFVLTAKKCQNRN